MRVTLLALELDLQSRSTNIARAMRELDRVADLDESPELIVVPIGCDCPQRSADRLTPAMSEMVHAAFAAKAREWGLLVAAGMQYLEDNRPFDVAVMFDADGDERCVARAGAVPHESLETVYGALNVFVESHDSSVHTGADWPAAGLTVVFGQPASSINGGGEDDQRLCEAIAGASHSTACLLRASSLSGAHKSAATFSKNAPTPSVRESEAGQWITFEVDLRAGAPTME